MRCNDTDELRTSSGASGDELGHGSYKVCNIWSHTLRNKNRITKLGATVTEGSEPFERTVRSGDGPFENLWDRGCFKDSRLMQRLHEEEVMKN